VTAPGFDPPEKDWDASYDGKSFVPQEDDVLVKIAGHLDTVADHAETAARLLERVQLERWKGAAADVFLGYVDRLARHYRTCHRSATTAATDVRTCATSVGNARADADKAAADLTDAQQRHKKFKDDKNFVEEMFSLPEFLGIASDFNAAYDRGCDATADALKALGRLADALDPEDGALAALDAPDPPHTDLSILLAGVPPEQRELLERLFDPARTALDKAGATDAAEEALRRAREVDSDDEAREFLSSLDALSPEELRYLFDHLDEDDIAGMLGRLDPEDDREVYNVLAEHLPLELQIRLADTDPNHYWHPWTGDGGPYAWNVPDGLDPGVEPSGSTDELQQGQLGDCHVLASLAAAERANPGFLAEHVRPNANGTYTVTLYKDGEPFEVTVTPEVPHTLGPDGSPYGAAYTHGDDPSEATLYQVYEKAVAQAWGELDPNDDGRFGYEGMDGGWAENDLPYITGDDAERHDTDDVSPEELREYYENDRPIVVSSLPSDRAGTKDLYDDDGVQMISGHAYYVIGIEGEGDDTRVILGNPWGADLPDTGTVVLSWEQFQAATSGVSVGE
jgi:hypothetical protein